MKTQSFRPFAASQCERVLSVSMMDFSDELLVLLRGTATCYIATTMADGSPQLTQTWVDTDGQHVVINTVEGYQKARNVRRDPRVALTVSDPANPRRYHEVRGRVVSATTDGGEEHIDALAQRYLGRSYPRFGEADQQRLVLTIAPDKINTMG